jgi:hypothetical protein
MPKPVKKAAKVKTPPKPVLTEHLARVGDGDPAGQPAVFKDQLSEYMATQGAKGGRISGAKRMTNLSDKKRREIAMRAAQARWGKLSR